jgi:HAD superfamily hydrolase (TIGR01458 family)
MLFDIDGVLTVSWEPLPGAADTVAWVRESGWKVAFVTNTSSLSRSAIAGRLRDAGIELETGEIFTAARAAAGYLRTKYPEARCLLLNSGSVEEDLEGVVLDGENANLVLTGGGGPEITYELLNKAFQLLLDEAPLVAMHRNLSWMTSSGPLLDMGAFLAGLEMAAHVQATVVGKPAPECFSAILSELGASPSETVMVGDDIDADVLGAQAFGLRGVLVRTGKFRREVLESAKRRPDFVIDSVVNLRDVADDLLPTT